ncbi:MAG: acylphosphatase [Phycisphaeraceae bacterium]|nr:MAG: acylphosphatase [Phycisphaeraceae bacterium]
MRYEVRLMGRVQGVGLRATASAIAREHGLVGWVRNEPDGSVMLVMEGDKAALDGCLKQLQDRMGDRISEAKIEEAKERGSYTGFEIRY